MIFTVNIISVFTVHYGHARSNYTQTWVHSLREEEEEEDLTIWNLERKDT
jgi:hypothetical protein